MQINLTTRKKSLPEKVLGTFIKQTGENNNVVYKARYSAEYKDEGHDYNKSFKVLRAAYWLKYDLLNHFDVSLYETLQFLCEAEIPFSLEILAERLKIGDATLRKCLDNLVNAELLEIVRSDGQGNPNYYIIRTPYFEQENFKDSNKSRYFNAYKDLPETFLETEVERLRRQIRKNTARKLRDIARKKNLSNRKSIIQKIVNEAKQNKARLWHQIVKKFGSQDAVNFDSIVWTLCHDKNLLQIHGSEFNAAFKRFLKVELEKARIRWNESYFGYANELRAFYDARLNVKHPEKAETKPVQTFPESIAADTATNGDNKHTIQMLNGFLSDQQKRGVLPKTGEDFRAFLKRNGFNVALSIEQILSIASNYFDSLTMQKITVELRR